MKLNNLSRYANWILGFLNISLFCVWLSEVHVEIGPYLTKSEGLIDYVSLLVVLIGVMLAVLTVVIALAGIFGFQAIREAAIDAAKKEAQALYNQSTPQQNGLTDKIVDVGDTLTPVGAQKEGQI